MNQMRECTRYRCRGRSWGRKPVRDRRQGPLDLPFRSAGVAFKKSRVSLTTFGHSASKRSSAWRGPLGEFDSLRDEPETVRPAAGNCVWWA